MYVKQEFDILGREGGEIMTKAHLSLYVPLHI